MTTENDRKSVRIRVDGRVQGVWFRGWTVAEASRRGLDGWVRNRRDGSVEAVLSGPAAVVEEMILACWQGPAAARVAQVQVAAEDDTVVPGFRQRDTR